MGTRVSLCGRYEVELEGERVEERLPGRQGRLLLAVLVLNRGRLTRRDELIDLLWPGQPPSAPGEALSSLLSKLRQVVGAERLAGRSELTLVLPGAVIVDFERAREALADARSRIAGHDPSAAELAREASAIAAADFLPGYDGDWVEERRRELLEVRLGALEAIAQATLAQGGGAEAETAARDLVRAEPLRESGHRLLMEALAARGDIAAALTAYEELRTLLREELGVAPSESVRTLQERLLTGDEPERRDASTAPPAGVFRDRGNLIGRDAELARLLAGWERAREGWRSFFAVGGEPGIGKTRLVTALAREAQSSGIVLYAACEEQGLFAYQPIIEALRQLVRGQPSTPDLASVGPGGAELAQLVPELAHLRPSGPDPGPDDPETRRYLMFAAVSALLTGAAARSPLLVVLDDLQWADRSTLRLLRHVLRNQTEAAVLIVVTYRDSEVPPQHPLAELLMDLRRDGLGEQISLTGLGEAAVGELVASHAGFEAPARFVSGVHAETDGNPFFVTELIRHAVETGAMEDGESSELRAGVPHSVQEVLQRRLGRLSPACREVLEVAAVIGRDFDLELLLGADGHDAGEEQFVGALEEALGARLVVEDENRAAYAFSHALVRQAIYRSLSAPRRRLIHASVAEALERNSNPQLAKRNAALAHHWSEAGRSAEAFTASLAAAADAEELFAWTEALEHRSGAVEMWDRVADAEARAGTDLPGLLARAAEDANFLLDPGRAIALASHAIDIVDAGEQPLRAAQLRERLGRYLWLDGRTEDSEGVHREAVALVAGLHPAPETARVLAGHAQVSMLRGRPAEGRESCERAIEIAREVGARAEEGQALNTLGACVTALGDPDGGVATIREAKRIADELPWVEARGRAYVNLSVAIERAGRLRESVEVALEGMRTMSGLGAPLGTIFLGNDAARRMVRLGLADDARRILAEVDDLGPFGVSQAAHHTARSELAMLEGRTADAIEAAAKAVGSFGESRDAIYFGPALAAQIGSLLAGGRAEDAASLFRSAVGSVTGEPDAFSMGSVYARGIRACVECGGDGAVAAREAQVDFAALLDPSRYPDGSAPPRALAYAAAIDAEIARLDGKDDRQPWSRVAEMWAQLAEEAEREDAAARAT